MKLEDIAKHAGVSRSTVSRVINNEPYVSEKTRSRVMAVIEEHNFRPNPAARTLVTQQTQTIGVVIPNSLEAIFADPYYFPTLLQGISDTAQENDYSVLLWVGQNGEDQQKFQDRILKNRLIDGIIAASSWLDESFIEKILKAKLNFVMIERPTSYHEQVSYVTVDNVQAAKSAVQYLIALGYQRIGTITGALDNPDGYDRFLGYKLALEDAGIEFNPSFVAEGQFTRESGSKCMKQLLDQKLEALFVATDLTGLGALDALKEVNIQVPDDLGIIGFNDLPHATASRPALTTIHHPIREKAVRATALLLDQIEGVQKEPQQILLPTRLVIRQSCGAFNR